MMLPSSKLVLQAQRRTSSTGIISDSEDSIGYLSEGEQYRRSRFPHSSKSPKDIHSPNEKNTKEKNKNSIYSCDVNITRDSPHLLYSPVFLKKRKKENHHDTVSNSEANQIENACPFYFSPLHINYKRSNILKDADDNESYSAGNLIHDIVT